MCEQHFGKSFINIPQVICKMKCQVNYQLIAFPTEDMNHSDILDSKCSSPLIRLFSKYMIMRFLFSVLMLPFKKYDVLMLVHITNFSAIFSIISRIINPRAKIYLKLDVDKEYFNYHPSFLSERLIRVLLKNSDVISYESKVIEQYLEKNPCYEIIRDKIIYLPNCPSERIVKYSPKVDKSKQFICVGRHGSHQKNSEMLLRALEGFELNDWKVKFIGSMTKEFVRAYEDSQVDKLKVTCVGEIGEVERMIKEYQEAQVLILTSRYEGFATVLAEAGFYANYIISTDVNGAADITDDFKHGTCISNEFELKMALDYVIKNHKNTIYHGGKIAENVNENFNWKSAILRSGLLDRLGYE